MSADQTPYTPPKIWTWDSESGGRFANINRPIAGLPMIKNCRWASILCSFTRSRPPTASKPPSCSKSCSRRGIKEAEYDAYLINIQEGDQFGSGFVDINPNSKIPALLDRSTPTPTRVFESASILVYLAEKFGAFLPEDSVRVLKPSIGCSGKWDLHHISVVGSGIFMPIAPEKFEYPINRFSMEVKRQLDVLDRHLADHQYFAGDTYTIADMAIWLGMARLCMVSCMKRLNSFKSRI